MQQCNEIITVINSQYNSVTDKEDYVSTVITGVSWFCSIETTVDSGLKAADKYTVRIPATADFSGKTFVLPEIYATAENVESLFTLKSGDIIVRGRVISENLKPAALLKNTEAFTIMGVTNNCHRPRGPHWKVIGA